MDDISRRLYCAAAVRELERRAMASGAPGYTLMQRAAAACWQEIQKRWPQAQRIDVVCGPGNNGGDGYAIARLARAANTQVRVWQVGEPAITGETARARAVWLADGGVIASLHEDALSGADLVVDALLGLGLKRDLQGELLAAVQAINVSGAKVLAVDVPTGLDADSGKIWGAAVRADVSVTFIGRKPGLYGDAGPEHAGDIVFSDLSIPESVYAGVESVAQLMSRELLREKLPARARAAHKGSHGHVLLIGGASGMMGSALLAARGALRAGAGLVTVVTRPAHVGRIAAAQPELMCSGVESSEELARLIERATVVVIGPGMGQHRWSRAMLTVALEQQKPVVVDADALNLLAQAPARRENWVLTPHPGEAARLLALSNAQVQQDRVAASLQLREKFGGVSVLKGAGTLVRGAQLHWCPYGNPGMAVGGMGDVLAGIIGGLIAQGLTLEDAANAGVLAHALAGDRAAQAGERGLLPSDLIEQLRAVINHAA